MIANNGEAALSLDLLHNRVSSALVNKDVSFEVVSCDKELADTSLFCKHYGYDLKYSANCLILASKKPEIRFAACVVLATHKLNNGPAKRLMGSSRISFAPAEQTQFLTEQEIGGVTPIGLPETMPVFIDESVMECPQIIIGGGNRQSKIICPPQLLLQLPLTTVHEGLARLKD